MFCTYQPDNNWTTLNISKDMKWQKLSQSTVWSEKDKATLESNSITPNKTDMNLSRGHELGQTLGDGEGHRGPGGCSPWGHKGQTGQLNNNNETERVCPS